MKFALKPASRLPTVPLWVMAVIALWLGLILTFEWLRPAGAGEATLCMFRNVTGVPCATCGSTRMVRGLGQGHVLDAVRFNPMMAALMLGAMLGLALRVVAGRRVEITMARPQRCGAWCAFAVLLLANWVYVINREAERPPAEPGTKGELPPHRDTPHRH
jgi:hypothetical protein